MKLKYGLALDILLLSLKPSTLCSFFWGVLAAIIGWTILLTIFGTFLIGGIVLGFIYGFVPHFILEIPLGLFFALLIVVGLGLFTVWYENRPARIKEPGFISTTYHAIKEKYCPIITWEEAE